MHAQADLTGFFVFFYQAIVGMAQLSGELFIMLRAIPGRILTFGFCGMLTAFAAGLFFDRGNEEVILGSCIDFLPKTD